MEGATPTSALATAAAGRRQRWGAQDFNKVTKAVSGHILSFQQSHSDRWAVCRGADLGWPHTTHSSNWTTVLSLSQCLNWLPCERPSRCKSL